MKEIPESVTPDDLVMLRQIAAAYHVSGQLSLGHPSLKGHNPETVNTVASVLVKVLDDYEYQARLVDHLFSFHFCNCRDI